MQVLAEIDNSRNPVILTRERLERAATENQFMNGKIQAISVSGLAALLLPAARLTLCKAYRSYVDEALIQCFPELESHLSRSSDLDQPPQTSAPTEPQAGLNGFTGPSFPR